jgi:flagellar hook-length control protein FliK
MTQGVQISMLLNPAESLVFSEAPGFATTADAGYNGESTFARLLSDEQQQQLPQRQPVAAAASQLATPELIAEAGQASLPLPDVAAVEPAVQSATEVPEPTSVVLSDADIPAWSEIPLPPVISEPVVQQAAISWLGLIEQANHTSAQLDKKRFMAIQQQLVQHQAVEQQIGPVPESPVQPVEQTELTFSQQFDTTTQGASSSQASKAGTVQQLPTSMLSAPAVAASTAEPLSTEVAQDAARANLDSVLQLQAKSERTAVTQALADLDNAPRGPTVITDGQADKAIASKPATAVQQAPLQAVIVSETSSAVRIAPEQEVVDTAQASLPSQATQQAALLSDSKTTLNSKTLADNASTKPVGGTGSAAADANLAVAITASSQVVSQLSVPSQAALSRAAVVAPAAKATPERSKVDSDAATREFSSAAKVSLAEAIPVAETSPDKALPAMSRVEVVLSASTGSAAQTPANSLTETAGQLQNRVEQQLINQPKADAPASAPELSAKLKQLNLQQQDATLQLRERVHLMVRQNIQVAEIRLDPAELGQMQIRVNLQQEQASVQFIVQQQAAKELLEQQMPRLREMLQQQGLQLGEGQVQQQQRQQTGQNGQGQQQGTELADTVDDALPTQQIQVKLSERLVDYYA